jgi:hypothetical protein
MTVYRIEAASYSGFISKGPRFWFFIWPQRSCQARTEQVLATPQGFSLPRSAASPLGDCISYVAVIAHQKATGPGGVWGLIFFRWLGIISNVEGSLIVVESRVESSLGSLRRLIA